MLELIDRRVLGALRLIDNTTESPIRRRFKVEAEGVHFNRNASNYYVLHSAPGLEAHTASFEAPPSEPALNSIPVAVAIEDPERQYLPRLFNIALPRDPDPENAHQPESLFQPEDAIMFHAPNASVNINWSLIRGSVFFMDEESNKVPVRGALIRVLRVEDGALLAKGLSDTRGEILITIAGIPVTQFFNGFSGNATDDEDAASGPVITSETPARLEVIVNPALPWPVNPDALEANAGEWLQNGEAPVLVTLKTRETEKVSILLDLSDRS